MILNETVAAIADAIREKKGKSELIKPVDFAEEIRGITSVGGENYYYIPMSAFLEASESLEDNLKRLLDEIFLMCSTCVKVPINGKYQILGMMAAQEFLDPAKAIICFSRDLRFGEKAALMTLDELLQTLPQEIQDVWQSLPKLTETEFYDLNS